MLNTGTTTDETHMATCEEGPGADCYRCARIAAEAAADDAADAEKEARHATHDRAM